MCGGQSRRRKPQRKIAELGRTALFFALEFGRTSRRQSASYIQESVYIAATEPAANPLVMSAFTLGWLLSMESLSSLPRASRFFFIFFFSSLPCSLLRIACCLWFPRPSTRSRAHFASFCFLFGSSRSRVHAKHLRVPK